MSPTVKQGQEDDFGGTSIPFDPERLLQIIKDIEDKPASVIADQALRPDISTQEARTLAKIAQTKAENAGGSS